MRRPALSLNILLICLYLVLTLYGIYQMKLAAWGDILFCAGFASYIASYGVWVVFLKINPLSKAYPIAAGSLIVATQLIDHFYIKEPVHFSHIAAIVLILGGITLIHRDIAARSEAESP